MAITRFEGLTPQLGSRVYLSPGAELIGDVDIGDDVSVWPGCVLRGDIQRIRIGPGSNIQDLSVLHVTHASPWNPEGHPLEVGNAVTVGHRAILHGCRIGDHCLIGMGAIIMDGACLEDQVMLGAGSLVPPGHRLAGRHLWLGSPARCIRPLRQDELDYLRYAAEHYVRLKDRYLAQAARTGP